MVPRLPISFLPSLSQFLLSHFRNSSVPHGTICNFCQLLTGICHIQRYFMPAASSICSISLNSDETNQQPHHLCLQPQHIFSFKTEVCEKQQWSRVGFGLSRQRRGCQKMCKSLLHQHFRVLLNSLAESALPCKKSHRLRKKKKKQLLFLLLILLILKTHGVSDIITIY